MAIDKFMHHIYDKERRSNLSSNEKHELDALRSQRRKHKRESLLGLLHPTAQASSFASPPDTTGSEATTNNLFNIKVMPPCCHCGAKRFQHEPPSFCCKSEKVLLAAAIMPPELQTLFTSEDSDALE